MGTATTKPGSAHISRLLSEAGMTKSTSSASRIKGWPSISPGFHVTSWRGIDYVEVSYRGGFRSTDIAEREMARASKVLTEKGYEVEAVGNGLKVRKAAK